MGLLGVLAPSGKPSRHGHDEEGGGLEERATLTVDSIRNQDFPVVQCAVVLLALIIVAINFAVDMIVGLLDPRIRLGA